MLLWGRGDPKRPVPGSWDFPLEFNLWEPDEELRPFVSAMLDNARKEWPPADLMEIADEPHWDDACSGLKGGHFEQIVSNEWHCEMYEQMWGTSM